MSSSPIHDGAVEGQQFDRKSLRKVAGTTADFVQLSHDCVCFANGAGGQLRIGIEDEDTHPPASQRIDPSLLDRIRKRIGELTVNVQVLPELRKDDNGGEYILVTVARSVGVASTSTAATSCASVTPASLSSATTCCVSRMSGPRCPGRP